MTQLPHSVLERVRTGPEQVDRCPVPLEPDAPGTVDLAEAKDFLERLYAESKPATPFDQRLHQVAAEIDRTGSYLHTAGELRFGARLAWRNAARCIGRLYWQSLAVRDRRHLSAPADVAAECIEHLRDATRNGQIRATLTVFAPDRPGRPGPKIHNEQLIRYAGHRLSDDLSGAVCGDPRMVEFTDEVKRLGWRPRARHGEPRREGAFDVLPLMVSAGGGDPELFNLPGDAVLEVPLRHPEHPWFADLGLRWYAVPAISNMPLVIGGVRYPAAPFNGWYMNTEIGARNLADKDRYDLLPLIGRLLRLDVSSPRTLWRDRALVELVRAVQYSFDSDGVRMADHHTESERFITHVANEERAGRRCPADWTWIVPPMSGGLTPVFHRYYDPPDDSLRPAFLPPKA